MLWFALVSITMVSRRSFFFFYFILPYNSSDPAGDKAPPQWREDGRKGGGCGGRHTGTPSSLHACVTPSQIFPPRLPASLLHHTSHMLVRLSVPSSGQTLGPLHHANRDHLKFHMGEGEGELKPMMATSSG